MLIALSNQWTNPVSLFHNWDAQGPEKISYLTKITKEPLQLVEVC